MLPKTLAEDENLTNNEIYNRNEITPSTDNQGSSLQNIEEMLYVIILGGNYIIITELWIIK